MPTDSERAPDEEPVPLSLLENTVGANSPRPCAPRAAGVGPWPSLALPAAVSRPDPCDQEHAEQPPSD